MLRLASLLITVLLLLATPALASEERRDVSVPAGRLEDAISTISRQTGASIGFRDRRLADLRVRPVSGRYTAGEALTLLLNGSGARPRRVASRSFLIERAPPARTRRPPAQQRPPATPAPAPPPPPPPPPEPLEIIVTASKRDVPISAYPGMVHVVEGDRVSVANGRQGTDALGATTASVVSTHLGPGRNKLFIRGIADSSFVGPTQSTVGQYWGNSRITYATPDPSLRLYDVGRIEVLEGPQGTLYGAGSLGGIVRVVPREPRFNDVEGAFWGGIEAVSHGNPGYDGGAVINLPLVEDRLALRAVAFGTAENGYIDDIGRGLDDVNDVDSFGGRMALRYEDDDGLRIDASLVGQQIDGADSQYSERLLGDLVRSSAIAQPFSNEFFLTDLVIRKNWNDLEFTLSAAYADQAVFEQFEGLELSDRRNSLAAPAAGAMPAIFSQDNRGDMMTVEARLARNISGGSGWLVAASFLQNDATTLRQMLVAGGGTALTGVRNTVDEATLYGEATVDLAADLRLTTGGRLTASRLAGEALTPVLPELVLALDPAANNKRSETQFLPSVSLAYQPTDELTLFGRYQEGFRPGGIAVRREYIQQFRSDSVQMAELGARFRGASVELEASASWSDWNNIQADIVDGFGFPTTANIGDGRVFSLGLSGRWRATGNLELEGAVYLNDSKVTQVFDIAYAANGNIALIETDRLPNIASRMAHAGFTWWTDLGEDIELEVSGHGRYVGRSVLGIGPILGRLQGDYFDTGVELQIGRGNMRYSLALTNLLDATGNRFALGSPFQIGAADQITPLKPRSLRLGIEYAF